MIRLRKYGAIALVSLSLLLGVQAAVSLLVRSRPMRRYLVAHLEKAFGRPVEVGQLSVQVLPFPELNVEAITIGEDPAFGNEYFLRAERMTAGLRWMGLFRGHFDFGTISFSRPSLILVRSADGHWNLERWLPPARTGAPASAAPPSRAEPTYHLRKIDVDDGRINFKFADEKRPFAFTNVSGSVEQVSEGRWQLQLEAQPWRSGVPLQSTGTLQVAGYVSGTSVRLKPAQIRLHWDEVSLADLFRLITGNDSGVRGQLAVDANASMGMNAPESESGVWHFGLQARAKQIHRWDLTERDDNPRVHVLISGLWQLAAGHIQAGQLQVELPHSKLAGSGSIQAAGLADWQVQFKEIELQGVDLLAWYRAFQPDVAEPVAFNQTITGSLVASGWPLRLQDGVIEGPAGTLRLPGQVTAKLDPFRGTVSNGMFDLERLCLRLPSEVPTQRKFATKPAAPAPENVIDASLHEDPFAQQGALRLNFHLAEASAVFNLAASFGHTLNQGWQYNGPATGFLSWDWKNALADARRNGSVELTKAELQMAGLNEPLKIEDARLDWKNGVRSASLAKVDAFGTTWSGVISEAAENTENEEQKWSFQLRTDRLDAAELDRWIGPRARPNWLQRLMPSFLEGANQPRASELLRRISAEGELTANSLTMEKIKLTKARAKLAVHALELNLSEGEAQWAGGVVRGSMHASFSPLPKYEVSAAIERVNMTQFPWAPRWGERWSGLASGTAHLSTRGVGREELLKQLSGAGEVKLSKIEFRGWDIEQSAQSGGPLAGASRWASGEGVFRLDGQKIILDGFRFDGLRQQTALSGTISFGMDGNLTFTPQSRSASGEGAVPQAREMRIRGQLENPEVAVEPGGSAEAQP